jgi:hypothetical protein
MSTNTVLTRLLRAPRYINPAVALCQELDQKNVPLERLLLQMGRVKSAIQHGEADIRDVDAALNALRESAAAPATRAPLGF